MPQSNALTPNQMPLPLKYARGGGNLTLASVALWPKQMLMSNSRLPNEMLMVLCVYVNVCVSGGGGGGGEGVEVDVEGSI